MKTRESLKQNIRKKIPKEVKDTTVEEFMKCWVEKYSKAMYFDPSGLAEPFEDFLKLGMNECVESLSLANDINSKVKEDLILSWTHLKPWKETRTTLKYLQSKGISLGVLSNGSTGSLEALLQNSLPGIKFDFIYGSSLPKCFKPKKEMYKQTESSGYEMDEVLHIAGADMEIEGARSYGLFAGFNEKASGEYPKQNKIKPCFSLKNLAKLKKYFSGYKLKEN